MQSEKRLFQRVAINLSGTLITNTETIPVEVLDVSLRGVRIMVSNADRPQLNSGSVRLSFQANEDSPAIQLTGTISHLMLTRDPAGLYEAGVKITHIDIEDLALLRRLLLLNSGQADMDATELGNLVARIIEGLEG